MSAIRNVGELASPYFLLEVWARREEIDIDPETYASLKQAARRLVRTWRVFEARGEDPDEEWRASRRALFGLVAPLYGRLQTADDQPFDLLVWHDEVGQDALVVGDMRTSASPDVRDPGAPDPPATLFELALLGQEGKADWGLLLAGLKARVYRRSSGISQQYLELDLETLVEVDDEANWKAFAGIFRVPAFVPGPDGVPLIRRVVDESRRHAAELASDMRADVVHAAESIIQGVLDDPTNGEPLRELGRNDLHLLFEETLYYLYRTLFILYAEARDVLPLSGGGPYATTYSVDHLVERARIENPQADGTYYEDTLRRLFRLLWEDPAESAEQLGFVAVGGELFDPSRTAVLDSCRIGDPALRDAIQSIALGAPGSARRRLGRRSSFAELGVEQLGSIYEGLLVLEPVVAVGPRAIVRQDGDRRVLERHLAEGLRVEGEIDAGEFVLESASGRRKGSGSFYTPVEITEYLTNATLQPLVDPILERARLDPQAGAAELLSLRVCDPAMGSGAFLVQAARTLGLALARIRAQAGGGRVTPELIAAAKREVVRRCLYGVDLNPLAVALAKVSLWLETLLPGMPLSFLDAHLRTGNSLVGVELRGPDGQPDVSELAEYPADAARGFAIYLRKEAQPSVAEWYSGRFPRSRGASRHGRQLTLGGAGITAAFADIATRREELTGAEQETRQLELDVARAFQQLEEEETSLGNRLRAAADFWCAQWFAEGEDAWPDAQTPIPPTSPSEYEEIVGCLLRGQPIPRGLMPIVEAARQASERHHFFHWALEFPEVMVGRAGFDAVIGNPPWNTLSPDVKEFFGTFDPQVFRKGVAKAAQQTRKADLRQDADIDGAWRREARFLYELSTYAKPESGRFLWFAPDPQLRKGDANVYRLFMERAYRLLRPGGRFGQVLPDSFYVSSPGTGVRQGLLIDGQLDRCFVFENRRKIFPIDSRIKVALVVASRGGGPTEQFRAAFFVGKDAAGRERTVGLEELPDTLAELDRSAPILTLEQLQLLAPMTWSFPELRTALDAEIAAQAARALPPLNLDERGWGLRYCRELDADRDAWRFVREQDLPAGSERVGLRWHSPDGTEWWPAIQGEHFYDLEFPRDGHFPTTWVNGNDMGTIDARRNPDGTPVMKHYRVVWRDIARSVDERSAIAAILPPRVAAKDKAPTVWGGSIDAHRALALAAVMSSFPFDYLVRFKGAISLKYGILNQISAPPFDSVAALVPLVAEVVCEGDEYAALWNEVCPGVPRPRLSAWDRAERRARIDAEVVLAYGFDLSQYAALLSTFPNLDRSQPMLPGEPKSFVTRDLALLAYAQRTAVEPLDIHALLESVGVNLPPPRPEFRRLDARVERYREIGAVPYRPTPRGARTPDDPELVDGVRELLAAEAQTAAALAEALDEDERIVKAIAERLTDTDALVYAEGRGANRRYYVIEGE